MYVKVITIDFLVRATQSLPVTSPQRPYYRHVHTTHKVKWRQNQDKTPSPNSVCGETGEESCTYTSKFSFRHKQYTLKNLQYIL